MGLDLLLCPEEHNGCAQSSRNQGDDCRRDTAPGRSQSCRPGSGGCDGCWKPETDIHTTPEASPPEVGLEGLLALIDQLVQFAPDPVLKSARALVVRRICQGRSPSRLPLPHPITRRPALCQDAGQIILNSYRVCDVGQTRICRTASGGTRYVSTIRQVIRARDMHAVGKVATPTCSAGTSTDASRVGVELFVGDGLHLVLPTGHRRHRRGASPVGAFRARLPRTRGAYRIGRRIVAVHGVSNQQVPQPRPCSGRDELA
jgi:hypothetical protein